MNTVVTDFWEDTTHMSVYLRRELRTDQSHDCSKSTWWAIDFWFLLLMNMGEMLLCKQKRWLKSCCISLATHLSQGDDLDLWSSCTVCKAQQSESLFPLQLSSDQVSPQPLLPPFDNAGEGLQRISQVSVPLDRRPLLSLLSLSHVRGGGEKRPRLPQYGKRPVCWRFSVLQQQGRGMLFSSKFT